MCIRIIFERPSGRVTSCCHICAAVTLLLDGSGRATYCRTGLLLLARTEHVTSFAFSHRNSSIELSANLIALYVCRPSRTASAVPSEGLALAEAAKEAGLMMMNSHRILSHLGFLLLCLCRPSRTTSAVPSEGLALAEAAEEDGLMADVVAMTGGAVGQDAIARLEVL